MNKKIIWIIVGATTFYIISVILDVYFVSETLKQLLPHWTRRDYLEYYIVRNLTEIGVFIMGVFTGLIIKWVKWKRKK